MFTACDEYNDLIALAAGDVAAFNAVYRKHYRAVYANIHKLVQVPEHAEEILQDVFVSLWQNRYKIRSDRPVAGWLFVVSYNKSVSFLKRELARAERYVDTYEPFDSLSAEESRDEVLYAQQLAAIEEAVETLPGRRKEVFKLCRLEGKSSEEAANLLNLSKETVKDYLKHATKTIRTYVNTHYPSHIAEIVAVITLCNA